VGPSAGGLVSGCWLLVSGCWFLVSGFWLLVAGWSVTSTKSESRLRVRPGAGFSRESGAGYFDA
jgi:hypothetical protein